MILVLSTDYYEQGTDPVVGYLAGEGAPFIRLSVQDLIEGRSRIVVDVQGGDIWVDGISLMDEVNVVWYRKLSNGKHIDAQIDDGEAIMDGLADEVNGILDFIFHLLRDKVWLPNHHAAKLNKLTALHEATQLGIMTPASRLFTRKDDLQQFLQDQLSIITKPISHNVFHVEDDHAFVSFSKHLNDEEISFLSTDFHTSLYQHFVVADHELRVFYLDGEFHTLASIPIDRTSVEDDIKLARMEKKVLYQPFRLESEEQQRLRLLMRRLDLNICTMDILYKKGAYYLVDINPFGQYLFESQQANQYLENRIAQWLIQQDRVFYGNAASNIK